jgi:hypothetical protein
LSTDVLLLYPPETEQALNFRFLFVLVISLFFECKLHKTFFEFEARVPAREAGETVVAMEKDGDISHMGPEI